MSGEDTKDIQPPAAPGSPEGNPAAPEGNSALPGGPESPGGTGEVPEEKGGPESPGEGKKSGRHHPRIKELEAKLEAAEKEELDLRDQLLRKQADFENYRKRIFREKEEAISYANTLLLQDLILILDDLERAIKSSGETKDFEGLFSGVVMIEKQFTGMLERKYGLKRFDSAGEEFDPERHEALAVDESEKKDRRMVLEDYLKGYTLKDRVLRHAKVRVSGLANE
ncbi:MAG: nucleotide exchange factor GrpE [Spirochaetales bacterium]|jgi:molecular chaperone GrpE|nr:nucleotide exchange factor GrpE [Spirochaetales bacterium]